MRNAMYGAGFLLVLLSLTATTVGAVQVSAPEIDGGSLTTGLGLLAGGVLMLRARWGAKSR